MVSAWQQRSRLSVLARWVGHWRNQEGRPPDEDRNPVPLSRGFAKSANDPQGPLRNCDPPPRHYRASAGESRLRRISMTHRAEESDQFTPSTRIYSYIDTFIAIRPRLSHDGRRLSCRLARAVTNPGITLDNNDSRRPASVMTSTRVYPGASAHVVVAYRVYFRPETLRTSLKARHAFSGDIDVIRRTRTRARVRGAL